MKTLVSIAALISMMFAAGCGGEKKDSTEKPADGKKAATAGPAEKKETTRPAEKKESAKPAEGGETPEKLFEMMKTGVGKGSSMSAIIPFLAPPERPSVAFGLNMGAGMAIAFAPEEKKAEMKAEYEKVLKKHNISSDPEGMSDEDMQKSMSDPKSLKEISAKMFKGVDIAAFIDDIETFMGKFSDNATEKLDKTAKAMTDLKIEGDRATATIEYENGSTETGHFVKIGGRWYMSTGE